MMPTGFCPFTEGPPLHRLSSTSSAAFSGRTAPPAGPAPPPLRARGLRHPLLRRISEGKHGYAWAQDHLPPANQTPTRCPPPSPHAAAAPSCGQGGAGTGPSHPPARPPTHARGPGVPAGAPAGSGQGAGRGLRVCGGWGAAAERRGARRGGGVPPPPRELRRPRGPGEGQGLGKGGESGAGDRQKPARQHRDPTAAPPTPTAGRRGPAARAGAEGGAGSGACVGSVPPGRGGAQRTARRPSPWRGGGATRSTVGPRAQR